MKTKLLILLLTLPMAYADLSDGTSASDLSEPGSIDLSVTYCGDGENTTSDGMSCVIDDSNANDDALSSSGASDPFATTMD